MYTIIYFMKYQVYSTKTYKIAWKAKKKKATYIINIIPNFK